LVISIGGPVLRSAMVDVLLGLWGGIRS